MTPPRAAVRLLTRVLRHDPAGPAILGDLHEDFVRMSRTRGFGAARRWYWREALLFSGARGARAALGRLSSGFPSGGRIGPRGLGQDGMQALRAVRRAPGFSLFTAAVIGLGVGAAVAVFSVLKPLFFVPLPLRDPGALVWIANQEVTGVASLSHITSRSGNLRDFRERTRSFDGLTGYNAFSEQTAYTLTGVGEPERLVGFAVAHDFLQVLGVQPLHGRGFTPEEGVWGGPPAVILSYGFWRRRFAADPSIVGRAIVLNEEPRTVAGVLPPSFDFSSVFTPGTRVDFLLPYPVSDETDRHGNEVIILGRMGPGITPDVAQADLDAVLAGLQEEQPDRWGLRAHLTPLQEHLAGPFRPAFFLLVAAAATLVLIVCVNVSNLLLARSPGRGREMAVRKSLGASQGRIARQLVLESLGVSLGGAAVGGGLAWLATRAVAGAVGIRVPLLSHVRLDAPALLVGVGVALFTGLLVSLIPALRVAEGGEASVLRESGRGSSASRGTRRLREGLVVAQVTLACVLLVVGGLLVRSFQAVMDVELGFDPSDAVAWQVNPSRDFESNGEKAAFFRSVSQRVAQIPGVDAVGLIDALPLGRTRTWELEVPGAPREDDRPVGYFPHLVDSGYLESMRIPLVAGRNLSREDMAEEGPLAMLMNESGAERLFPGQSAVGRTLQLGWAGEGEIVGVVRDVRHVSLELGSGIQLYLPLARVPDFRTLDMVVRSPLPASHIASEVAAALQELDPHMPAREYWTVRSTVDRAVSARRFTLGILSAYGIAALLLAGLGIYGVLAQSVSERTAEIGIRLALGASASRVAWNVMGRTLLLATVGIGVGAVLSMWCVRLVASLLFGVRATDPLTFGAMALVLLSVAAAAGLLPATRAARTRGAKALRAE
ncbi:MAG: ADOP family duplicated permease [Longimicrobiales bacterium]